MEANDPTKKAAYVSAGLTVQFTHGDKYMSDFSGSVITKEQWIVPQMKVWEAVVLALTKVMHQLSRNEFLAIMRCQNPL